MPVLFGVEGESIYKAALGRDGSILIGVYIESEDENSMGSMEYYYCPVDGEEKKVEIGEALDETMAWSIDIGENGNLFLQISEMESWKSILLTELWFMSMRKENPQIICS